MHCQRVAKVGSKSPLAQRGRAVGSARLGHPSKNKCKSKNSSKKQGIKEVKVLLSQNTDIMSTLDEAHLLSDKDSDSQPVVMNASFLATTEGQESDSEGASDKSDSFACLFNRHQNISSNEGTDNEKRGAESDYSNGSAFNNNVFSTSNSQGSKRRRHQKSQCQEDSVTDEDSSSGSEQNDSDTESNGSEYSAFSN